MTLNLAPEIEAKIVDVAKHEGLAPEEFIEKIVREYPPPASSLLSAPTPTNGDFGGLTFGEKFGDLIGAIETGPTDMARHPEKYMKGFGETTNRHTTKP